MSDVPISFPLFGDFSINPPRYFLIGSFKIYWYGVILALAVMCLFFYSLKQAPKVGLTQDNIYDMLIICVPAAIIGCRVYYVVFNWALYKDNIASIFNIRDGGIGMYGGIIFSVIAVLIYSRKKKIPLGTLLDSLATGILLGHSIGRWGNFINREAHGTVTDLPWKMGLTYNGATTYVHPTFLYEALWTFLGFILFHFLSRKRRDFDGQFFLRYVAWYGFGRFMIEGLRTDSLYFFGTGIRVSQLLGILSCVTALALLLIIKSKKKGDPLYIDRKKAELEAADIEAYDSFDDGSGDDNESADSDGPDEKQEE